MESRSNSKSITLKLAPPANYCNQFLLDHLQALRKHCQRLGMDNRIAVYSQAMASIRKYPLPIISPSQLKSLLGVGDYITQELTRVIRNHYRQYLKAHQETGRLQVKASPEDPCQSLRKQDILSEDGEDDSRSVKSQVVDRAYKPRARSTAAYFLQAMKKVSHPAGVLRREVKQIMSKEFGVAPSSLKSFGLMEQNLLKGGFIAASEKDPDRLLLTEKSKDYIQLLEEKTKAKDSQQLVRSIVHSFKSQSEALSNHSQEDSNPTSRPAVVKTSIFAMEPEKLCLLVDCREVKDKGEQSFFTEKLREKYAIQCRSVSLPIGDFLWTYDGEVLEYIVERKKADDLAGSIHDGRYKEQKYRLSHCGIDNVYYLFEGHPSKNACKTEKELKNALLKTRIKNRFRVVETQNISESVKFLSFLHRQILAKMQSSPLRSLGSLQRFTDLNSKTKQLSVEQFFGLGLKTLPGVGPSAIAELVKYFKSFNGLRLELGRLESRAVRIEFLRELFKGSGVRLNLPQMLVDFLFSDLYS